MKAITNPVAVAMKYIENGIALADECPMAFVCIGNQHSRGAARVEAKNQQIAPHPDGFLAHIPR